MTRTHLRISLTAITRNVEILRSFCSPKCKTIAVVKANGYGHGAVPLSRHLKRIGVERLAVATIEEGKLLRRAGIPGPIHLLGSMPVDAAKNVVDFDIIPSVCTLESINRLATVVAQNKVEEPVKVHLPIDTGMSRIGVQPEDVPRFLEYIESKNLIVEGFMTHFADAWCRPAFTEEQLDKFERATAPYPGKLRHTSGSAGIIRKYGVNYDFVRPGISLYGLPPDTDIEEFKSYGFQPALSWIAYPTLVKTLPRGRSVGYSLTYVVKDEFETIATIPIGYADGYRRTWSNIGTWKTADTQEVCRIAGRVSMDQITLRVPHNTTIDSEIVVYSSDFDEVTSVPANAAALQTVPHEIVTLLAARHPRYYELNGILHRSDDAGFLSPVSHAPYDLSPSYP